MADALVFPRLLYRGLPDTLGQGTHSNDAGELVGETKQVDDAAACDAALKDGWRLTRDEAKADDAPPATGKKK